MSQLSPKTAKSMQKKSKKPQSKKPNRKRPQRTKDSRSQAVARAEGQSGVDTRVASATVGSTISQLKVKLTDPTIDVRAQRGSRSVEHLAQGIVLYSLSRGWASQTRQSEPETIYAAYVYLVQSFYAAMKGTVPSLQSAPMWYWGMVQALLPTTTRFKTSAVTFKWDLEDGIQEQVPPPVEVFNGTTITFGMPTNAFVNSFPIIGTPVYTPDLGEEAVKSMFEFFTGTGLTKMSPYVKTPLAEDVSAFSLAYAELGSSSGSPGGMATTIYSEKRIVCPILAQFCEYQKDILRGWAYAARGGGTPNYILPRMCELQKFSELKNQIAPIYKFYDFDEFFEVLSLTMGYALERAANFGGALTANPCPLSPQQVQILLRQTILPNFSNYMAMDVLQNGPDVYSMPPFSAGTNGVSITAESYPMKLPMFLAETIRAATRRVCQLPSGILDFIPILSRKESSAQLGNYTWGTAGGNLVYSPPVLSEFPINLIDASYTSGGTVVYLDLNGQEIASYSAIWNEWITGLSNYLSPLTVPGQVQGPAILSTLSLTRTVKYTDSVGSAPVAASKATRNSEKAKSLGSPPTAKMRLTTVDPIPTVDNFKNFGTVVVTSTNTPLAAIWKYQRVMVLPVWNGDDVDRANAVSYRQVFQIEPFRIAATSSAEDRFLEGVTDLLSTHKEAALFDIRSELAEASELVQDFEEILKSGEGGFFTSLVGAFAEDVLGIRGAKSVAQVVADHTGW